MQKLTAVIAATVLTATACGSGSPPPTTSAHPFNTPFTNARFYPAVVSSDLAVGNNRVLIGMFNSHDAPIGSPQTKMRVSFYNLAVSQSQPVTTKEARFVWAIHGVRGLWEADGVRFDDAGQWGAAVTTSGGGIDSTSKVNFTVNEESIAPSVGEPAPASDSPTIGDVKNLQQITTDRHPSKRFYKTSIAQAIARHENFVVVFATPKYCTSEVCGPTLELVKRIAPEFPKLTFIHVEVYTNLSNPSALKPAPAAVQWRLPSEPWTFVVDRHGTIAARFEGTMRPSDLKAAIKNL
ncbi:MAG: hypothetical protein M3290_10505 [Actinomycetota bacterium]|nr:hypothetical protein [Actinomycetota bacterium]